MLCLSQSLSVVTPSVSHPPKVVSACYDALVAGTLCHDVRSECPMPAGQRSSDWRLLGIIHRPTQAKKNRRGASGLLRVVIWFLIPIKKATQEANSAQLAPIAPPDKLGWSHWHPPVLPDRRCVHTRPPSSETKGPSQGGKTKRVGPNKWWKNCHFKRIENAWLLQNGTITARKGLLYIHWHAVTACLSVCCGSKPLAGPINQLSLELITCW